MANQEPTSGVVLFVDWLKNCGVQMGGRAVDIGSGKGRNTVYLAAQGFETFGLEYIQEAVNDSRQLAADRGVSDKAKFVLAEIDKPWDFEDDYFDVAIDSFASIDIETKAGREICRNEMYRTLKPGGYAFVNVCSADDEWEKELILKHPGLERNSTIWPGTGKFQKDYDDEELKEFYGSFKLLELRTIQKQAHKLGRDGTATNLWLILQK